MKTKPSDMKKKESSTFITMSTISDKLATDQNYYQQQTPPKPTTICGCLNVHKVAIFGISFNAILLLCLFVYTLIRLCQKQPKSFAEIIVVLSIIMTVIMLFTFLFVLAIFRTRHKLLLPYMVLNIILFFAYAGAVVATIITIPDEIREEVNGEDRGSTIADIILLRVGLVVFAIFQIFFIYSYIFTFIDVRRLNFYNRR